MWSKSNSMFIAYVAISAMLVVYYLSSGGTLPALNLSQDADLATVGILIALGLIAAFLGATPALVTMAGTMSSFIALTATQEPLIRYLTLAAALFALGVYGIIASRNAVRVLMSIELMLNAANINLVAFARYVDPGSIKGQVFAIFILVVAAAEAAVGLAIVLSIYRNMASVDMERFNILKW